MSLQSRRRAAPLIALALAATACAGRSAVNLAGAVAFAGRIPPIPSARVLAETITRTERMTGPRVPILLYHHVAEVAGRRYPPLIVDPYTFADQMGAIAQSG